MKKYFAALFLILTLVSTLVKDSQSKTADRNITQKRTWKLVNDYEFPIWIALNSSPGSAIVPRRHLYLFIQAEDFTEENLKKVFINISMNFPDPRILYVTVCSGKQTLERFIEVNEAPLIIDFAKTSEGEKAQRQYNDKLYQDTKPCLEAYYFRSDSGEESFQYNQKSNYEKFIYVKLKDRTDDNYTGDKKMDFLKAAKRDDIQRVKELLDQGVEVNSIDFQGETALMKTNNLEMISFLLAKGANINAQDKYGLTVLHQAADSGQRDLVGTLLHQGANLNLKSKHGYTPLMLAARNGHIRVVDVLLKAGADATAINNLGQTAVMLAREKGHIEVVHQLESLGIQK